MKYIKFMLFINKIGIYLNLLALLLSLWLHQLGISIMSAIMLFIALSAQQYWKEQEEKENAVSK